MLSSLGARRDRSRSPPEGPPPSKVFIQAEEDPQQLGESDTRHPTQQPETKLDSLQSHETFLPKIVVQEYREEKMSSPPMPYTYAQAVLQNRTKSPPEGQALAWQETTEEIQHQTQEQGLIPQQQLSQQEQLEGQTEQELKQQQSQEVQQKEPRSAQLQQQKQEQHQVEQQLEMHECQVQQQAGTDIQAEPQVRQTAEHNDRPLSQQTPVRKPPVSSQQLQSRKAQAMKNRPWLQKSASGEHKTPVPDPEQDSTQETIKTRQTQTQSDKETKTSFQVVPQHTETATLHQEAHEKITGQPRKPQKEQQKQAQQIQNQEQQQEQLSHQQQQNFSFLGPPHPSPAPQKNNNIEVTASMSSDTVQTYDTEIGD